MQIVEAQFVNWICREN